MPHPMLQFPRIGQHMPDKRDAETRARDFGEIYAEYDPAAAELQAARCSQCGVPFCQVHCPLQNNIPDWLMLAAGGRLREAWEVSQATNTFPEICGRICPQDRLCEGNCVIEQSTHGTVTIGAVERYLTENAFAEGWVTPRLPAAELAGSVGIIGAGPAGLAAAEMLRAFGWKVTIYDRHDRVGGLLIYGIPNFKLDKHVVARREALLRQQGIEFRTGFAVGRDGSLADLRARHDAVLIATGVYQGKPMQAPGVGLPGIHMAMEYLIASNRKGLGDAVPAFDDGTLDAAGKRVVVIGGGDTAMDCVRTAIRQGAKAVTCLYRRDRDNMPGSAREVRHAEEEGVTFTWLSQPVAFTGKARLAGVKVQRMRLGLADGTGRQRPEPLEGEGETLKADLALLALGFDAEDLPRLFDAPELPVTPWGTLRAGADGRTDMEGVFAAGDIVRGASLVVWAIKDGREAAQGIDRYLRARARVAA